MVAFIARMIMKTKNEGGLEKGQLKYKAYFVKTAVYVNMKDPNGDGTTTVKEGVDTILEQDGYGDCIVAE